MSDDKKNGKKDTNKTEPKEESSGKEKFVTIQGSRPKPRMGHGQANVIDADNSPVVAFSVQFAVNGGFVFTCEYDGPIAPEVFIFETKEEMLRVITQIFSE